MKAEKIYETLKSYGVNEISIYGIVDYGNFEVGLSYFNGKTVIEKLENLVNTVDLNPPIKFKIIYPDGEIVLVSDSIANSDLELELRDVKGKIEDILDSLVKGEELDEMQLSFLRMHHIL